MSSALTKKDLQNLGLGAYLQANEDVGFIDQEKTAAFNVKKAFLDLENLGPLSSTNPRLVIRKQQNAQRGLTAQIDTYKSWRQAVISEHYLAKYRIATQLVGQLSEIHFPLSYYSYTDNNFFKPWSGSKIVKRVRANKFKYARFRFPKKAANTIDIKINTKEGFQNISPKYPGLLSLEEDRKTYYRWHKSSTSFASGQQQSVYDELNLSGFNIPYPNSISIYESEKFNIPVKLATKFNQNNTQALNGIILISTGDAEQKTVCYISPHTISTGYLNTVEDFYIENQKLARSFHPGSQHQLTVKNASWYGTGTTGYLGCGEFGYADNVNGTYVEMSVPTQDGRKRFHKISEINKQVYFETGYPTEYGNGRWAIAISGNLNQSINNQNSGVLYVHQPNSLSDWQKADPRKLSGPWVVASGYQKAASGQALNRAGVKNPTVSPSETCRKERAVLSQRLQLPSLIADSKYINDGKILPPGIYRDQYTYQEVIYPSWQTLSTGENESNLINVTGNQFSGYIIGGNNITYQQILSSGIQLPTQTRTGYKHTINNNGHFKQNTPLKDTYYYKFYNQLYKDNNKTLATGTWNGIIPSGVRFSVELVSVELNELVGINLDTNISVIYSGFGTLDATDSILQTGISKEGAPILFPNPSAEYIVSGEVPWVQERNPYNHTFDDKGMLVYTSFKSGPTQNDAVSIAKVFAIKKLNSKILSLVNKIFPTSYNYNTNTAIGGLIYKNRKWKNLQKFKQKLTWLRSGEFSHISIPETAEPGAETKKRLVKYSS
jgi:hypothetical protein